MIYRILGWTCLMSFLASLGWWAVGRGWVAETSVGIVRFWIVMLAIFLMLAGDVALVGQLRYFLRRAVQLPVILAIIYLITFALVWIAPGDPFAQTDKATDRLVAERNRRELNAESWYGFLTHYPYNILVHGNFGPSLKYRNQTVNDILRDKLPVSVMLGVCALLIAVPVGVTVGTLSAVRRGGVMDWLATVVALTGISVPSFVVSSLLVAVLAGWLGWFPTDGWRDGTVHDMILPSIALSLLPMAYITRLTRVSMIDVLSSDFVRTARAKGLSQTKVIWKHCLRNALLPVVSYLGPAAATTLVGSFVVEKVFNIPGLGQFFVTSVQNRDQTLILGTVMVESALLLTLNLVVDIAYTLVDPRIEVSTG